MSETVRNPGLFEAFRALSVKVCQVLFMSEDTWKHFPVKARKELATIEKSTVLTTRYKPDYPGFLSYHNSLIFALAEAKLCLRLLEEDSTIGRHLNRLVGAFTSASRIDSSAVLRGFLDSLASELQSLRFDDAVFFRVYKGMEDFFYSDVVLTEVSAPLEGFHSDADVVDLGDNWSIRRVSQTRLESLLSDGGLPEESWRAVSHAIVWLVETPKQIIEESQEMKALPEHKRVESSVREILSALRLFKAGVIGCRLMDIRRVLWTTIGSSRAQYYSKPCFRRSYEMKPEEAGGFKEFLKLFRQTSQSPVLEVAIRRVNYTAERGHKDDHLIDSMVAFESLYLDDTQELSYRLSLRVAAALREPGPERIRVFEDMRLAYRLRSMIVHGGTDRDTRKLLDDEKCSFAELLDRIDCYLRESVKLYMTKIAAGFSRQQLLDEIERRILSDSRQTK